ncbi:MAG TPA: DUF2103 domain-containing protein [Chloroflexota bacterium]|nr:DUF2103 domain-containing protein [Chloroflexota bacterium]
MSGSGRHRVKGVKREHSIIAGLLPILERLAQCSSVSAVIPGRISVTRAGLPTLQLRRGTQTITGFKLNARRATTAQEVFVVTTDSEAVLTFLREQVREFVE